MKQLIEILANRNFIFKHIEDIDLQALKIKSKIKIYKAVSIKKYYCSIFKIDKKSRFITKDANKLLEINESMKNHFAHNFKKSLLVISSPLCSKASKILNNEKWEIFQI